MGKSFEDIGNRFKKVANELIVTNDYTISNIANAWKNSSVKKDLSDKFIITKSDIQDKLKNLSVYEQDPSNILENLQKVNDVSKVDSTAWQKYFDTLEDGEKWQEKFVQENDLTKVSIDRVDDAQKAAKQSAIAYNNGLKEMTIGAKVANIAMKALAVAGNIAFTLLLNVAIKKIDGYINRIKYAKEALDDFNSSAKDQQDSLSSQKNWIAKNGSRYKELAKGVDEYGHNVSLTSEKFSEYNSLTKDIADMFPNMIQGYNDQNDAIIKNKGSIEELTKSYEDNQKAYYANIRSKSGTTFSKFKTATKSDSDGASILGKIINGSDVQFKTSYNDILGPSAKLKVDGKDYYKQLSKVLDKSVLNQLLDETKSSFKNNEVFNFDELTPNLQQKLRDAFMTLNQTIDTETDKVRPILQAYLYGQSSGYDDLDNASKSAVQSFIQNVDSAFFEKFDSDTDMETWLTTNIINPLKDGAKDSDIAIRIQTLFSLNKEDFDSYQDYVNAVLDIINGLENMTDKDGNKIYSEQQINNLKTQLGVGDVDSDGNVSGQKKIDNGIDKFKDIKGADEYIKGLSEKGLNTVLYKIEPDKVTSLKDLKDFVQKDLTPETQKSTEQSFEAAWSSLKSSEQKKFTNLVKNGKLTAETFNELGASAKTLKLTGLSVNVLCDNIRSLVGLQTKLENMSTAMKKVGTAYQDFKKNGYVSSSSLNSMPDAFKNLKGYSDFSKVAGNKKSSKTQIQGAFNDIVSEYIETFHILDNVTEQNKEKIITALRDAGITNANDLIAQYERQTNENNKLLNKAEKNYMKYLDAKGTSNAITDNQINKMNSELINSLGKQYQDDYKNWLKALDKKKEAYNKYVDAYNKAQPDNIYDQQKKGGASAYSLVTGAVDAKRQYEKAKRKEKKRRDRINEDLHKIDADFNVDYKPTTSSSSSNSGSKKSKSKSKAQEIDWIARKLTVLQNAIDSTSKRLQNLFSIKTKKSNLNKQISETGKLLKANQKAAKAYKKEANKVKLSGNLKRKVESGDYDIKKYNQKTADKINKYQDYIDKVREARDAVQDNMASIRDLNQQKLDNIIDWFDKLIGKINAVVSKLQAKNDLNKKIRSMIGLSETGSESTYNEIISNQTSGLTTMTDEYKKYNAERKAQRKKLKTDINRQNKKDRTAYKNSLKKQGLSDSQIKKKMRKYDKKNKNKGKDQLDDFDADTLTKQNELRQAMYEQMSAIIDTAQELANIPLEKLNTNLDELNDQFSDLEKQTELAYEQIEKMNTGLAYYKKSLEEEVSTKWKAVEAAKNTVAEIEGKKNKAAINISALTKGAVNPDDVKSANDLDAIRIQYGDEVAAWVSEYLAYTQSLSDANKQLKDTLNEYVDTIEENSKSLIDAEEKIIDKTNELAADEHNRDKQRRSYTDNTLDKRLNSADKNLDNTYYDEVTAKKNKRDTLVSKAYSKGTVFGGWESYLEMNGGGTDQQRAIASVLSNVYENMKTFNPDTDDYNEITISSETISQIEDGIKEGWIPESVLKSAIESNERVAKALETNNEYQNSKSTFDNETMPEYFKERVNIIMTDSDRKQEKYKKSLDNIDNRIDTQSYGYRHHLRFAQKGITQDQIKANKAEEERLKSELKDAESKGLEKGSDAWNEIYDNIQKVKDEGVELAKKYVDYLWKGFDDIGEVADRRIKDIQNTIDEMDDNMSLKSTQGRFISSDAYVAQSEEYKNQQKASEQRVKDLEAEFAKDMADPANNIEEGSAEWYKRLDEIDQARKDARDQGIKAADAMIKSYDAVLSAYSNVRASIDRLSDEADFYQDILGRDDTINKDTGALTKNGVASIALSYEKMTNDIVKNQQIAKDKEFVQAKYDNGDIGIEKYNEEMDKLNSEQRDIIKNYYDERDAIISLVEEGLQKQLDYLQEIVDKYKEILDKESDLRSYNNTIEEKTKEISSLQKQLAVANAIDTEEGRANAQSLQKQLEDAQKDLDDTEWDKHKSDMEEILDNMMEDAQDFIDDKLDDVVGAIEEIRDLLPDDSSIVHKTITDIDEMWGTSVSDGLSAAIKTGDYSTITSKIESSASQIVEIVGKIEESRMAESIEEIPGYLARIENIVSASHGGVGNITGYASGGIVRSINRNISRNNDDVLITAKNGEAILDPQQTKLFSQFVQDMPYQYTTPVITPTPLPTNKATNKVVNVQLDGMSFNLPNVTDTDSFINAWKTDKKMKNFVSDVVNGTVMGDNSKAMRY